MYIDDSLVVGDSFEECALAVKNTCELFDILGFTRTEKYDVYKSVRILTSPSPAIAQPPVAS